MLSFGPFTLNRQDGRLTRPGAAAAELKPKALSLLLALADNAGRLVSKDELLDRVWGTRYITNGVIKTQMAELRAVLEDDPKSPKWIETVHGRGYRFLSSVSAAASFPAAASGAPLLDVGAQVGRTDHLVALHHHLRQAMQGTQTLVGIAGDPGVGKSMLLATFTASLEGVRVVSGQCAEQWGGTEPYLPILNALDRLCSSEPGVVETVRDVAPMWLGQMPWHLKSDERVTLQAGVLTRAEGAFRSVQAGCIRRPTMAYRRMVGGGGARTAALLAADSQRTLTYRDLRLARASTHASITSC